MAEGSSWSDRLFGTGVLFTVPTVLIAFLGMYQADSKTNLLQSEVLDQEKLRFELKEQLKKAEKSVSELNARVVKLEAAQSLAKVESAGAAVQANVAQLQSQYNTPEERTLLRNFAQGYGLRQRSFADMMKDLNTDPTSIKPAPPPSTLPDSLNFLKPSDKSDLEVLLGRTNQGWSQPTYQTLPTIDWKKFSQPLPLPKKKSVLEQVGDTVKAYPAFVALLLLFLVGSILKK